MVGISAPRPNDGWDWSGGKNCGKNDQSYTRSCYGIRTIGIGKQFCGNLSVLRNRLAFLLAGLHVTSQSSWFVGPPTVRALGLEDFGCHRLETWQVDHAVGGGD